MNARTWKAGIISTDYDLHRTRKRVIRHLDALGFEVVAFERPNMRVEPHVHSHEACVRAIEVSDIIVLLVDRRYGGLYLGRGRYSVT